MLHLPLIGFILWILYLIWRNNTKSLMIPVKEDKTQSDGGPPSGREERTTAQSPPPGERSPSTVPSTSEQKEGPRPQTVSTCGDLKAETTGAEALQVPSAVNPSTRAHQSPALDLMRGDASSSSWEHRRITRQMTNL